MALPDNVWPFPIEAGSQETFEFKSQVLSTYTGEQRLRLRKEPRRIMSYAHLLDQEQLVLAKLKARRYNQNLSLYIPIWTEQVPVASVGSADTSISFPYARQWKYNAEDKLIFWKDWNDYTVVEVLSVDTDAINFEAAVGVNITNCLVMPLRKAWAYEGFSFTEGAVNDNKCNVSFTLGESSDVYGWYRYDLYDTTDLYDRFDLYEPPGQERYNGTYIRSEKPFRLTDVERHALAPVTLVDNGFGPIVVEAKTDYLKGRYTIELFCQSSDDYVNLRDFVTSTFGKIYPFYLPTFHDDMTLISGSYSGTTINIEKLGYVEDYVGRGIYIEFNDGSVSYSIIDSAVESTNDFALTLADSLTFNSADVLRVSFMNLVRADTDTITFTLGTASRVVCKFSLTEVPA